MQWKKLGRIYQPDVTGYSGPTHVNILKAPIDLTGNNATQTELPPDISHPWLHLAFLISPSL